MSQKILITYGSWTGSTAEVAEAIGKTLREGGAQVDVVPAKEVKSIEGYSGVVIGSAVRAGLVHPQPVRFVGKFSRELATRKVAYFVVCLTMKDDTPENRCTAEGFIQKMSQKAPNVQPVDTGLFAGAVDYERATGFFRMIIQKMPQGDYRNWDEICAWAQGLQAKLQA